jgi:hypothetical protein
MKNPLHTQQHTMMMAVHSNNIDIVKQHLPNIHVTWEPDEIFCYACQKGRLEIVQLLLPLSHTNMDHGLPLRLATGQGHYDVVQYILPYCDATLMRSDALQMSVFNGETKIFELLYPHSDCVVALEEVNDYLSSIDVDGTQCFVLRDRLAEIVAAQLQKECLNDAVATVSQQQNVHSARKI